MSEWTGEHPEALLPAYSVGDLPPAQRRLIEGHLATCARCRARLQALLSTAVLLRHLPSPALPRSFLLPPTTAARRQTVPWLLPVSFLSAAAVLFLALGLSLAATHGGSAATTASRPIAAVPAGAAYSAAASTSAAAASSAAATSAAAARAAPVSPAVQGPAAPSATVLAPSRAGQAPEAAARSTAAGTQSAAPSTAAAAPAGTAPGAVPASLEPYQVLLVIGGIACLAVALGALARAARRP